MTALLQVNGRVFLLAVLFLSVLWTLAFPNVHASTVATRLPGVKPGDNATYVFTNVHWETSNSTVFPNPFESMTFSLVLRITTVSGANVTFIPTSYFLDGTSLTIGPLNLDVQTQSFCITSQFANRSATICSLELTGGVLPLLAAGLQAPDAVGANPSITLNQTVTEPILGSQRTINFHNTTSVIPPPLPGSQCLPFPCSTETYSDGYAWDQESGILVEESYFVTFSSAAGNATGSWSLVIANTNIWSSPPQDFSIVSNPSTFTLQEGETGSSTIALTSLKGFAGTVNLQASTSSSQLSCLLSKSSVALGPSGTSFSTISCSGAEGTYTVTVMATAANLSHSTILSYTVLNGQHGHYDDDHKNNSHREIFAL